MMTYDETPERKAYIDARGYVILSACPGSGKTTSIVRKLFDVSRYCKENYGYHTGFACLSFTNKACDELRQKYYDMHGEALAFPNIVSTIDSFIMQNIVLPYWYLYPYCKGRPQVVNEQRLLHNIYFNLGKYPKNELKNFGQVVYSYAPEKIAADYGGFYYEGKVVASGLKNYCNTVVLMRYANGIITSQDALVMALNILSRHNEIASIIAHRYPYIIVDEAQDNSYLQYLLFGILKNAGLKNLEFVGDTCQSIYRYRNAHPETFMKLMKKDEWKTLHFKDCRRSNQRIIDLYNKLRPLDIPPIKSYGVQDLNIPIIIYKYDSASLTIIMNDFEWRCKKNNLHDFGIIARGSTGIKRLLEIDSDDLEFWKSPLPYLIIEAFNSKVNGNYDDAFRKIRLLLGNLKFGVNQYKEKREFIADIEHNLEWNRSIYKFLEEIPSFALSFEKWTEQTQNLLQSFWSLKYKPDFQAHKKIKGHVMKVLKKESVSKYYSIKKPNVGGYKGSINTIHSYKGASLDAVLLFLSPTSRGQSVSLHDFPLQPIAKMEDMTEKQSMIYVACSRAKQFLAIAVPKTVKDNVIAKTFSGIKYDLLMY